VAERILLSSKLDSSTLLCPTNIYNTSAAQTHIILCLPVIMRVNLLSKILILQCAVPYSIYIISSS